MNLKLKEHRKGLVGTILFHLGLVAILLFFGFSTPLPLPSEEGILVNFGYEDEGGGEIDPNPAPYEPLESQDPPNQELAQNQTQQSSNQEEEVVTQDIEEAAKIDTKKNNKPKEKTKEQLENERIEKERKEQERIEKNNKRIEAEKEAKRVAEELRRKQEIENRFKNSFGQGQNQNPNNSTGQGLTTGNTNQGSENGDPNSSNYGQGKGLGDEGISYALTGRGKVALPKPVLQKDEYGTVVVEIRVNAKGDVVAATPINKGSNTSSVYLRNLAKEAALKARFTDKPNSPDQIGTITYRFVLE